MADGDEPEAENAPGAPPPAVSLQWESGVIPADDAVWDGWYLESFVQDGRTLTRLPIRSLPFRIGRREVAHLTLSSDLVSKDHAEIYADKRGLRVRDLSSTNGTFINHQPVQDAALAEGDVVHFASFEFRLARRPPVEEETAEKGTTRIHVIRLPDRFGGEAPKLRSLLREAPLTTVFQSIVRLADGTVFAHEALGRGAHHDLPESPHELLQLAELVDEQVSLSRRFRQRACEMAPSRSEVGHLFLNLHPSEIDRPDLMDEIRALQATVPERELTLELHESAVTHPGRVLELRAALADTGMSLAYDDFGAGQARLLELSEAPPDFLKLSMRLIHGIDTAPSSRHRVLGSLVALARELGTRTIAEGVETPEDAAACASLGFDLAQGYHFGGRV
jgi:EAL domain-containing protein (putative c-di-GMP-specific phosphodiesterase class I)